MVLGTTCTSLNFITLFTLGGLISLNTSHRFYELHRDSVRSKLDGLLFDPGYQGHEVISITPKRDRRSIDPTKTQHTFQAFKKDFELSLQPAEDVVSPQLVLMRRRPGDVWTKELYTPEGTFLQGHVTQDPRSHVAVRELGSNQLSGAIISGGHEYKIEPVPHHIRRKMDLEGHGHHVISRRSLRSKRSHAEPFKDHEVSISKSASRRRRDLRETKYIEAMITMDKPTTDFYGDKSMDYVLAIANMANRLYADKSVGFPLVFCLTKVFLIESNLPALDIVKNKIDSASRYLHVFSKWFQTVNTPEGSAEHFDNAVMLTRETCGINKCTLDGLAYFGSPCSSSLGASVNDAYGLATAFSVAHEVAHNFGVDHDFGTCSNGHIMSAGQSTGATAFKWSACSRKTLMEVFSRVKCYDNRPPTNITLPSLPPGHEFDGDEQCRIVYGQEYKLCSVTTGNCGTLFCMRGSSCVNTRGMPPVDGTPCGHRKWCISGHCEDVGDSYPMAVDGAWGAWGDYSTCSRTCGGGVRHRSRRCDNPKPQYGGKDCPGSPKGKWRICNAQDCPPGTESYRKTQCVAINSVYTNYYNTPDRCSLWCREGSSAVREGQVADGTRYDEDDPDIRDICIAGERVAVGCDDLIGSGSIKDRCGRCLGNGSSCVHKEAKFTKPWWHFGPGNALPMMTLPVGTANCLISEDRATMNLVNLKLYPAENNSLIFPDRPLTSTRFAAGSLIRYKIGILLYAEEMFIRGPTTAKLVPMYVYIRGGNVGYTIKYFAPGQANETAFLWKVVNSSQCNEPCAGGFQRRAVTCHREDDDSEVSQVHCDQGPSKPDGIVTCNTQPCPPFWEPQSWRICSQGCGPGGTHSRDILCKQKLTQNNTTTVDESFCNATIKPPSTKTCNVVDCGPGWEKGEWSVCAGVPGQQGTSTRSVECRNRMANGSFPLLDEEECLRFSPKIPDRTKNCTVDEAVPGKPYGIDVTFDDEIYFVTWKTPIDTNGVILGYKVYFELNDLNEELENTIIETEGNQTSLDVPLSSLFGDKSYLVGVAARTSKGYGEKSTDNKIVETPAKAPVISGTPAPDIAKGDSTAEIKIPVFSNVNGPVKYFYVVNVIYPPGSKVAPGDNPASVQSSEFVSYCEAHRSAVPVAYLAFKFNASEYKKYETFTLGGGEGTKCDRMRRNQEEVEYYNGPLQPNIEYKPFVRGYTSENKYAQVDYDKFQVSGPPSVNARKGHSGKSAIIIGSVIAGVVLLIVVVVVVVWRLRKRGSWNAVPSNKKTNGDDLYPLSPVKT